MIDILLLVIGFLGLIVGTITDFQKREVADWINFGLIYSGIGIRLIYSIIEKDAWFLIFGLFWLFISYLFGLIMYYTGQWGGGDCKMIMGLGSVFGTMPLIFGVKHDLLQYLFNSSFSYNISFMINFLFNAFLIGSIYGLIYVFVLVILKWKKFKVGLKIELKKTKNMYLFLSSLILFIFGQICMYFIEYDLLFQIILILVLILPTLFIFIRLVEKTCMNVDMKIKDLTEGEWIINDIYIDNKYITGPKELGISLEQINQLKEFEKKGKIKSVKVKIGIPFVPAFLFAFIATLFWSNILLSLLGF